MKSDWQREKKLHFCSLGGPLRGNSQPCGESPASRYLDKSVLLEAIKTSQKSKDGGRRQAVSTTV